MPIHVDISIVHNDVLDIEAFRNWSPNIKMPNLFLKMENISADGSGENVKSMFNVINPDDIVKNTEPIRYVFMKCFLGLLNSPHHGIRMGLTGLSVFA